MSTSGSATELRYFIISFVNAEFAESQIRRAEIWTCVSHHQAIRHTFVVFLLFYAGSLERSLTSQTKSGTRILTSKNSRLNLKIYFKNAHDK